MNCRFWKKSKIKKGDFSFLRFQYITTGALFIISILTTSTLAFVGLLIYKTILGELTSSNRYLEKTISYLMKTFIFVVITFINSLLFLLILNGENVFRVTVFTFFLTSIWTLPVCLLIRAIIRIYFGAPEKGTETPISTLRNLVGLSKYLYLPVSFIFILIILFFLQKYLKI